MAATAEIAALKRALDKLVAGVAIDLKSKPPLGEVDRRMLKREIEACMQTLDELRTRVSG